MDEIDRSALDAQTGGDRELAREVLGLFAAECRSLLHAAADVRAGPVARADAAHTLKGAAAGIGAARVRALADVAEARLRSGDPGSEEAVAALARAAEAALDEIAREG
ncbi:Hpt domain-containing protein [Methylobacterium aerolatum]|uniref:HPt (Histidine-containing phosphotransfer) domain-containing protein n=1 Tax=Methylobacterium aerolatum TaxID=418708 RepID=A0ABU0I066_9HYPH|nr:Hpt domain-containing protein [Methylobacterium aerolatum]MDQ0447981.1 HPt (histidine-containing phosphotransfer) domain-containing protein [Methylobacterium aerolatum]GJD36548.1 hypothetical protein FMGBMHLM_3470 [Methylobacterium aerolatum]